MAILVFIYAGIVSAVIVLSVAVASLLTFTVRALFRRRTAPEYGAALRDGLRYGLVAGAVVIWAVLAAALVHFRASRYVVIDYWWSLTWVCNAVAAGGLAMVLLFWFARTFYLRAKGRLSPDACRRQVAAASCAYLCLWASVAGAYRFSWRPWYRSCALRTIQEESFSRHIFPALGTFINDMSPAEERQLASLLDRVDKPTARFNAAYILARRGKPDARHAMAAMLLELEATGTNRHDVAGRYLFPVGLARACLMQMTGDREAHDTTPPQPVEWQRWKRWHRAQSSVANHIIQPETE